MIMMASRISGSSTTRPLFIDFDFYTDGDPEFKKELITLMIDDLHELQHTLHPGPIVPEVFNKVCHKIKSPLEMLNDKEMLDLIAELKIITTDPSRVTLLDKLCTDIVQSLQNELEK